MTQFEYVKPGPDEIGAVGALLNQSLHFQMPTQDAVDEWLTNAGHDNYRVVRVDGKPAAALRIIESAQWFGGKRIPATAISAVGAAPEFRGRGAASHLMQRMHEEVRGRGFPISVLYPATLSFYRHSGYERAGTWHKYELALSAIDVRDRDLDIEPATESQYDEIKEVYHRRATADSGFLDRWPLLWKRMLQPKDKTSYKYIVRNGSVAEGYVIYFQGGQFEPITVLDMGALTRPAARRILTFFADHRSLATNMVWHGGTSDPFLFLLGEQREKMPDPLEWVVRITDVEQALRLRGFPPALTGDIHLDVTDTQIPENNDRFVLSVTDGGATVVRGGQGTMRLDIRTLASLFTGHRTARELQVCGNLDAPERELSFADLLFAGPKPWMPDIF